MSNLSLAISSFLTALEREGEQVPFVDNAIASSVEIFREACQAGEYRLRCLFATEQGAPILQDPYLGLFDIFDLPREALLARPRSWDEPITQQFPLDHQENTYYFPHKYLLPLVPKLRRTPGTQCIVDGLPAFRVALGIFSGGALSAITDWDNIVIAGGAVLACLTHFPSNPSQEQLFNIYQSITYKRCDIDMFLWGMTEEQARTKMNDIFDAINSAVPWNVYCFRTKNAITIQGEYPKRPLQIVMRLYRSPAEILCGFDVDACCVAYNGTNVFTNPRGLNAIVRQCNRIDVSRRSPSYEHRLIKYSSRGYEVYYPDLNRHMIDYLEMGRPFRSIFPKGLGRLIVYELIRLDYEHFEWLYEDHDDDQGNAVSIDRLRPSNYDYGWIKIPYGVKWWSPQRVKERVEKLAADIISIRHNGRPGSPVHLHVMTCGSMNECLEGCCDVPILGNMTIDEGNGLFNGPAVFITDDPGRQAVGSFNPINRGQWESEAYHAHYSATTAS